ncbi:MAG: hypothetical protein CBC29_01185 [Methylococcaceae bacterium TMED69]|nr:MAG: hypothetical protein CBC29_01185 [Methylococcaceae bacterium TMED69]|tara:strand:+ start:281 stop:2401 length:2121 start_codon:yes stop_codon:yes gene_type:complete
MTKLIKMHSYKKFIFSFVFVIFLIPNVYSDTKLVPKTELGPTKEHVLATRIITQLLENYHYKPVKLTDDLSLLVFNKYINALDPMKIYFTLEDIKRFEYHSLKTDDYLEKALLTPLFEIFKEFRTKLVSRSEKAKELIKNSNFNFEINENITLDRDLVDWAESELELDQIWRKKIKNETLNLKLNGKSTDSYKETLAQRYEGIARRTKQLNRDDVYQIIMNSYTTSIDPHTAYFSPRSVENFKIQMSLSLEGIGAVLQNKDELTVIRRIIPGGPADFSRKLFPNDRIISIGQNLNGNLVDVVGWRLDDVVDLIRGPKGSTVRLEILPKKESLGGKTNLVEIIRDEIKLEEQAAKGFTISVESDKGSNSLVGVIEIPTFYQDFDAKTAGKDDYKSTTKDVQKIIEELTKKKLSGLIVDVRNNGGGSLSEATSLTGLFINKGPVVQVKNWRGRLDLERDNQKGVAYDGPLLVLVNRNSASASEIFSGAIQDYGRGLVIGEPTFGKGTVQNLVDLNRYSEGAGKLGQLKTTMAQFFRVNGESTQHRGVIPDIQFFGLPAPKNHGEKGLENALPWAKISQASYRRSNFDESVINSLVKSHQSRIKNNKKFQHLVETEKRILEAQGKTTLSLVQSIRESEHEKNKKNQLAFENEFRFLHDLKPLTRVDSDGAENNEEEASDPYDEPKYDSLLMETGQIMIDFNNKLIEPNR